ncbi:phosphoglycerate mutase [Sphingomonas panacis]|uniref:Phosphoglycerate mutase n=1 Tax=Sphingomonas panacis TaxID=1560345 RepID=A0A1B3ZE35_9SPHN|nr:histidine phosphatase family protein [Sphingomonas panacis]AOH85685.1 phosphoglycerate mutase [Sphingomonas panacis]
MTPTAQIYLLRHGETEWNTAGRFQGRLDSALTSKGIAQAEAAARRLAHVAPTIDAMFSSPLGRARQTADILCSLATYPPVQWDDRLQEVSVGSWDGLTHFDIDACWPGLLDGTSPFDWFFRSPDGESYDAAVERVRDWLAGLVGTVIAVSHGLLGRIIRGVHLGLPKAQALQLPVPQDVIWHLHSGKIDALTVEAE